MPTTPFAKRSKASRAAARRRRLDLGRRIELGLAISAATLRPGESRRGTELAAYCECSKQLIDLIQQTAIAKVRRELRRRFGITSTDGSDGSDGSLKSIK